MGGKAKGAMPLLIEISARKGDLSFRHTFVVEAEDEDSALETWKKVKAAVEPHAVPAAPANDA